MWFGGGKPKQEMQPIIVGPDALGGVPLFDGLAEEKFQAVLQICEETTYEAGATLFRANTVGDAAYFVLSGTAVIKLADGGSAIQHAGGGALLGELSMLVDVTYNGTATAKDRVTALTIHRAALHSVMNSDPSIADHFSQKLVGRLLGLADEIRAIDAQFAALEEVVEVEEKAEEKVIAEAV
jgi:CRP/FNR family transcriptional regulator, cyclic AMP receptor protein